MPVSHIVNHWYFRPSSDDVFCRRLCCKTKHWTSTLRDILMSGHIRRAFYDLQVSPSTLLLWIRYAAYTTLLIMRYRSYWLRVICFSSLPACGVIQISQSYPPSVGTLGHLPFLVVQSLPHIVPDHSLCSWVNASFPRWLMNGCWCLFAHCQGLHVQPNHRPRAGNPLLPTGWVECN